MESAVEHIPQIARSVVFVVDDEPRVLSAVSETIGSLGCTVRSFSSADECLKAIRSEACDLLVTDINMPEMDGMELMTAARDIRPLLPVIIVTGYGDIPLAVRAVKEGALDFVEKPLDETSFLPLVRSALNVKSRAARIDASTLTPAERRILQLVAHGKTNKEIAQLLGRSLRTVENHRHRLMQKLQAESVADLVKVALKMGLADTDE